MANLTIRNLPDDVRDALRVRAARRGRSMEAEVRQVLIDSAKSSENARSTGPTDEQRAALRALQASIRAMIPEGPSIVDELIAERRAEQAAEDAR